MGCYRALHKLLNPQNGKESTEYSEIRAFLAQEGLAIYAVLSKTAVKPIDGSIVSNRAIGDAKPSIGRACWRACVMIRT